MTIADPPSSSQAHVLLVDSDEALRAEQQAALSSAGHEVVAVAGVDAALDQVRRRIFDVVVTAERDLLPTLQTEAPETQIIALAAAGDVAGAVEAMKHGAFDCLAKPLSGSLLIERIGQALSRPLPRLSLAQIEGDAPLVYADESMVRVVDTATRVAPTDATVLLSGESGTGKELVARLIHARSGRATRPFIAVNCAALSETLLDSELFGHEKGAFTGADKRRQGRFEAADGGTLLLDEVGEMSAALQAKVLRVLQERSFERVGSTKNIPVDVRVIAATHRHLMQEVTEGRFREDLFYRLNVVPIHLPPLRERGQDVLRLADHFLADLGRKHHLGKLSLSPEAKRALLDHRWRGNVRELHNIMMRASILCRGDTIGEQDLFIALPVSGKPEESMPLNLKILEKRAITKALVKAAGNRRKAAELLGLGLRTLHYKLKDYELG